MADELRYDIDGHEVITKAIRELLNTYPDLDTGEEITFSTVGDDEGISFYATNGALIQRELKDVTGHVEQTCVYPFMVIYKASGLNQRGKVNAKEWLDRLGEWLERKKIKIGVSEYQLLKYPPLTENRKIEKIARTTPAYLLETTEDKVDSWVVYVNLIYTKEFDEV